MSLVSPISSEIGLRNYERDSVEIAVPNLVDEAYDNLRLRIDLGLHGTVTFESHTNLGETDDTLSEHMHRMSIEKGDKDQPPSSRKSQRRARGKATRQTSFASHLRRSERSCRGDRIQGAASAGARRGRHRPGVRDPAGTRCDQQR
ncbi:hypothetical protein CDEST_15606 [Colletotrichum destructivum]|uniref:Uncharacterized protein n=1 Tax=Colletotrichum destructivum TaxID=34406 RepID=A0AAX4J4R4_9PEZI|nr:hypothetical protein CDEST_15606 [Colletotrichum destructivum]